MLNEKSSSTCNTRYTDTRTRYEKSFKPNSLPKEFETNLNKVFDVANKAFKKELSEAHAKYYEALNESTKLANNIKIHDEIKKAQYIFSGTMNEILVEDIHNLVKNKQIFVIPYKNINQPSQECHKPLTLELYLNKMNKSNIFELAGAVVRNKNLIRVEYTQILKIYSGQLIEFEGETREKKVPISTYNGSTNYKIINNVEDCERNMLEQLTPYIDEYYKICEDLLNAQKTLSSKLSDYSKQLSKSYSEQYALSNQKQESLKYSLFINLVIYSILASCAIKLSNKISHHYIDNNKRLIMFIANIGVCYYVHNNAKKFFSGMNIALQIDYYNKQQQNLSHSILNDLLTTSEVVNNLTTKVISLLPTNVILRTIDDSRGQKEGTNFLNKFSSKILDPQPSLM